MKQVGVQIEKFRTFYKHFVPRNYIQKAATIMDCNTTWFSLAGAWDISRMKRDLLLAMKYNRKLAGASTIKRQADI